MEKFLAGFVFIFIIGFFSSCDLFSTTEVTVEFDYIKFNAEKTAWNSSGPSDYQYNLDHWNSGFSEPVKTLIFVENGLYKNQTSQEDYADSTFYLTITDIYSRINERYLQYNNTIHNKTEDYLKKIIMKYDEINHIPIEIYEYYHITENIADAPDYCETKITQYKIN